MFSHSTKKDVVGVNQVHLVTPGSVNVDEVDFHCEGEWGGLKKTAVFRAGDCTVSTLLDETETCIIPWEVFQDAKRTLYAGVYGTKNGNTVLPTIWASLGEIRQGCEPGESTQPPTPSVYEQILAEIGNLDNLATSAKDSLVSAINELYYSGGGGGGTGNVYSPDIGTIIVMDQGEYDLLETKDPRTLYLIRG